jgi:hypothetical protein
MTETKNAYTRGREEGKQIVEHWKLFLRIDDPVTPQYAEGVLTALRERKTVAQAIASAAGARKRCAKAGNTEWFNRWTAELKVLQDELPSGSGIDSGTSIDLALSDDDEIRLDTSFHHMNDGGMYDGWTSHTVVVTPAFEGLNVEIQNDGSEQAEDIEGYLADVYREALSREYEG